MWFQDNAGNHGAYDAATLREAGYPTHLLVCYGAAHPDLYLDELRASTLLYWCPVPASNRYDAVSGSVSVLYATHGNFSTATDRCVMNDTVSTSLEDTAPPPSSGLGKWYLVRNVTASGNGTYDSGAPSQVGSRDAGINASPSACP